MGQCHGSFSKWLHREHWASRGIISAHLNWCHYFKNILGKKSVILPFNNGEISRKNHKSVFEFPKESNTGQLQPFVLELRWMRNSLTHCIQRNSTKWHKKKKMVWNACLIYFIFITIISWFSNLSLPSNVSKLQGDNRAPFSSLTKLFLLSCLSSLPWITLGFLPRVVC